MKSIQRALVSVSDKTGIVEFCQKLHSSGIEILSTGGTADLLKKNGVNVTPISDYTGFPEMMDGRVKTLHPKVHGGILGRRDLPEHMQSMQDHGILPIDLVVINLYPFEAAIAKEGCTLDVAVENIDIGGPAMIRSAAKNFDSVTVVVDPSAYAVVLKEIAGNKGTVTGRTRKRLSRDAYAHTARYDSLIAGYLTTQMDDEPGSAPWFFESFKKVQDLRYGENPHQSAALYKNPNASASDIVSAEQLQGKELSFNNIVDLQAAWGLVVEFDSSSAVVIKHTNPCGVAVGQNQLEVFINARDTDSISAFGGILGFNREVQVETAQEIVKNFVEAVIAPGFSPEALEIFKAKKNVRVMVMSTMPDKSAKSTYDVKRISGGILVQDSDEINYDPDRLKVVTERQPTEQEMKDLLFAWTVAKHVKSNAIVYALGGQTIGVGAGQMSRVDSAKIAVSKAQKSLIDNVMASDAFFPFRDSIDEAAKSGIIAIIQPGGSIRDEEVIQAANEHGISMVFTGIRHFNH
jgi:phosphoribosylaminoimidazolecarboxamide formyltransferase/IMP cyclohydrolase